MRLDDVITYGNERYFEAVFTYGLTIDYKEIFRDTLNLCEDYFSYESLLEYDFYNILLDLSTDTQDQSVIVENTSKIEQGYIFWLMDNWSNLKTSKDISEHTREIIQEYVDELNERYKS